MPSAKTPCPKCGRPKSKKAKTCKACMKPSSTAFVKGEGRTGKDVPCAVCGKLFYKIKSRLSTPHHYCSRPCSDEGRKTGEWRQCKRCGKDFYMERSRAGKFGIYCGQDCHYADHNVECECEACGKIFNRRISRQGKFCSRECRAKGVVPWNKGKAGTYFFPQARTGKQETCKHCGKLFYVQRCRIGEFKFCCTEHRRIHEQEQNTVKIACRGCGEMFQVKRRADKERSGRTYRSFCSDECRKEHYCGKIMYCAICATPIPRPPSALKDRAHIFCGKDCLRKGNTLEYGLTTRTGRVETWEGRVSIATTDRYEEKDGRCARKYKLEHRMKIAEFIGRQLTYNEEPVLHLNGVLSDNRLENTYVCESRSECMRIVQGSVPFPTKSNLHYLRDCCRQLQGVRNNGTDTL